MNAKQLIERVVNGEDPKHVVEASLCRCKHYDSDSGYCETGCRKAKVTAGDPCPWGSDDDAAQGKSEGTAGCPCYK
jgi:hypothetical protein